MEVKNIFKGRRYCCCMYVYICILRVAQSHFKILWKLKNAMKCQDRSHGKNWYVGTNRLTCWIEGGSQLNVRSAYLDDEPSMNKKERYRKSINWKKTKKKELYGLKRTPRPRPWYIAKSSLTLWEENSKFVHENYKSM